MHSNYEDILALTTVDPLWYDQNGTPRYAPFHPNLCPSIYATNVFLLRIACQLCGEQFSVEMHYGSYEPHPEHPKHLHYGDPPAHDCTGDSMNCDDLCVLQAWYRPHLEYWTRTPELEVQMISALDEFVNKEKT